MGKKLLQSEVDGLRVMLVGSRWLIGRRYLLAGVWYNTILLTSRELSEAMTDAEFAGAVTADGYHQPVSYVGQRAADKRLERLRLSVGLSATR